MNKTKFINSIFITCALTILLLCPASAIPAQASNITLQSTAEGGETIQPRAPVIEWVFKVENGVTYRRLYNYSTGEWIGDWIPCE